MKSYKQLIANLNSLLADNITTMNLHLTRSEILAGWGYHVLHSSISKLAMDKTHHAEWFNKSTLIPDGAPAVSAMNILKLARLLLI